MLLSISRGLFAGLVLMTSGYLHALYVPDDVQDGWEIIRDQDGIQSFKKQVAGSNLLQYKAVANIDAPIDKVMTVLIDGDRAGEWIPNLVVSWVLENTQWPFEYVQFTRFDAPWPIADRIFLSRVTIKLDRQTLFTDVHYHNTDASPTDFGVDIHPHDKRAVRGSTGGSRYIIQPVDDGRRTNLIAISVADPNGALPKWIVNWVGTNVAHQTMERLRKQVARVESPHPGIAEMYEADAPVEEVALLKVKAPVNTQ